jgi:hypothetical protein
VERFNYFSDIEDHFCRRRGTVLMVSPLDWALMETWKEAGLPLEAVLRGIDSTFEKYDRRPTKTRKINGLGYCTQEVLAAAEDMKEAAVGSVRETGESRVESDQIRKYLEQNAALLAKVKVPGMAETLIREDARVLQALAKEIADGATADGEAIERRLTVMEEKLFAALLAATEDEALVSVRAQAEKEIAPYRGKMTGPQIEQLLRQYTNKKLLERYGLPRLSLFYM